MQPGETFFIDEVSSYGGVIRKYPGSDILLEIDSDLVEMYDLMRDYVFGHPDGYYLVQDYVPVFALDSGYDSESAISDQQLNVLIGNRPGKEIVERYMLLADLQFLIGSIQNLILAMDADFINFYKYLSQVTYYPERDGTFWTSNYDCWAVFSSLTSYITKAYSIVDIIVKLAYEFEKDPGTYMGLNKLRSKSVLCGARDRLRINGQPGTIFEETFENPFYQIESLRNELVHNGSWQLVQKVYIVVENSAIVRRFILYPDFFNGHLVTFKNRKRFFACNNHVNEHLVTLHNDFLSRLKETFKYMLSEYRTTLPQRDIWKEVLNTTPTEAIEKMIEYYQHLASSGET